MTDIVGDDQLLQESRFFQNFLVSKKKVKNACENFQQG